MSQRHGPRAGVAGRGGSATRMLRVEEQLRQELSEIMVGGMKDERVRLATVTTVRCAPDLRQARVLVSALGSDEQRALVIDGLRHAEGFLRGELGHRLENLRTIPRLHFELDESIAYSVHIHSVLRDLGDGDGDGEDEPAGGETAVGEGSS